MDHSHKQLDSQKEIFVDEVAGLTIAKLNSFPKEPFISDIEKKYINFEVFSKSSIWKKQDKYFNEEGPRAWQENTIPHYITNSPSIVHSYSRVIVSYIIDLFNNENLELSEPIYIFELAAGCGRFAIQMINAIEEILIEFGLEEVQFCYLISDYSEKNVAFIKEHPYLENAIENGKAKVIQCDVLDKDLNIFQEENDLKPTENPLIVIGNYLFDSLEQELLYLHYGELYQGLVGVTKKCNALDDANISQSKDKGEFSDLQLLYRWEKVEELDIWLDTQPIYCRSFIKKYLENCIKDLHDQPLLLPIGALRCLNNVANQSKNGILFIGADSGIEDLTDPSAKKLPELRSHGSFSLPVNFDFIKEYITFNDGISFNISHRSNGLIFNVSYLSSNDRAFDNLAMTFQAINQYFTNYNPDDFFQIKRSLHNLKDSLSEDQMISYLRLSFYDPKVLALFLPSLLETGIDLKHRVKWCNIASRVWENYIPIGENTNFIFQLGIFAVDLSHWALSKDCFFACLEWDGDSSATLHNLAIASRATGAFEIALECVDLALSIEPENKQIQALSRNIKDNCIYLNSLYWFDQTIADPELKLIPIMDFHTGELFQQYRDPQIAMLSRSFEINTPEDAFASIEEYTSDQNRVNYAVIHGSMGFLGCCALAFCDDLQNCIFKYAHFSFWIGVDHQRSGYGKRVLDLSIKQALALGLDFLLTSVWGHNLCSIHVLKKGGFLDLGITKGGDENREHYMFMPLQSNYSKENLVGYARELLLGEDKII